MTSPPTAWETELFVVQGDDRPHLRQQVRDLSAFLERHPGVCLKDLAWSLNGQPLERRKRLALVAGSVEELRQRLARAADRLQDASCRRIRDVLGIYFADEPLYPAGKVALLFPGEGAPYPGMLGDLLPHFPETAEVVARCDAMNAGSEYDPRRLSRFVSVPSDPAERAEQEAELRRLGNTMFSVLMATWALLELLRRLELPVQAMAGHSAGELAALWISGCLEDSLDLGQVQRTMATLEEGEDEDCGTVLLAVGASRETLREMIEAHAREGAGPEGRVPAPAPGIPYLAMDNCPHQTVVVAAAEAVPWLERELAARKLVFERLPFHRPYHTPLFEPYMGPLAAMFEGMAFQRPHTTLYSCTTARPFPNEPDEIRRLALAHWVSPVEFTRMIRSMHDDGVRLFVEAGPRGNLTAFVDDILRGRPFVAVPCDTPRRSGLTQLNHLAAQLTAQHVPLRLAHFYERRRPQRIEWQPQGKTGRGTAGATDTVADGVRRSRRDPAPRGAVVSNYWRVMEQFLDVQSEVMQRYLERRRLPRSVVPVPGPGASAPHQRELHEREPHRAIATPERRPDAAVGDRSLLPMISQVVRIAVEREVVVRRRLDLEEDRYGGHHTVGGREVSHVHPERNGQPVMPMTFSLEWMAEAATLMFPGLVVTAIRDVQLLRWLSFDEERPATVELTARVAARAEDSAEVHVQIRDLGPASEEAAGTQNAPLAAAAVVEMAARYPEPPPVGDFPLSNERPCRIPLDVLYKNLFHGEHFQGVSSLDRFGDEGIQGQVRVLPRGGLFRSHPDPQFVLDPVLMDVAMHPLAGWHLEQPDQTGRILLPYELKEVRFYGPRPTVGTVMTSQGRIVHASGRRFTHSVDVIGPDGRLWCRMHELKYWRFYLPFGEFNFHGPKDDYFLSESWPAAIPRGADVPSPGAAIEPGADHGGAATRVSDGDSDRGELRPVRDDVWCVRLVPPRDLQQPDLMLAAGRVTLAPRELQQFRSLDAPPPRKSDWLFGKLAAKDAVRHLWKRRHGERLVPADLEIQPDPYGRPVARPLGRERPADFPHVSIAHTEGVVVAAASFGRPVGIDAERVVSREESFERIAFDDVERRLLDRCGGDRPEGIARFWCAREAVAKALGRGLIEGPRTLAVRDVDPDAGTVRVVLGRKLAEMFPHHQDTSFPVHTLRDDGLVIAVAFDDSPEKAVRDSKTASLKDNASLSRASAPRRALAPPAPSESLSGQGD